MPEASEVIDAGHQNYDHLWSDFVSLAGLLAHLVHVFPVKICDLHLKKEYWAKRNDPLQENSPKSQRLEDKSIWCCRLLPFKEQSIAFTSLAKALTGWV